MIKVEILKSQIKDVDSIKKIEDESFSVPWSRESIVSTLENDCSTCLSAVVDRELAGYAFMSTVCDECEILDIAVSDKYRRRGIAKLLLGDLIKSAKVNGASTVYLEVRSQNTPALSLYQKSGFAPVGIRKDYYKHPAEDAVIMKKILVTDGEYE